MGETDNKEHNLIYSHVAGKPDARIERALNELIDAFRVSDEYQKYQEIRKKVHTYPELEEQIHAYRKKNYEVQNSAGKLDLYEETERMEREDAQLRDHPLVREYLAAELAFCRIFKHINWSIIQNIDFDVGFMLDTE